MTTSRGHAGPARADRADRPPARIYVAGAGGRLGREVAREAARVGFAVVPERADAGAWLLAIPREVVEADLASWTVGDGAGPVVIDLSGAFKHRGIGRYALLTGAGELWDGPAAADARLFANPGCIASAVIAGLERSGLRPHVTGAIHVTAVTAGTAAHRDQVGTVRVGRRWWDHPHVPEIERALQLACASFVPLVDYGLDRGIVATISGTAGAAATALRSSTADLDVASVQRTPDLRWHLGLGPASAAGVAFTLAVALDNLTFPAANAVAVARRWLDGRGPR